MICNMYVLVISGGFKSPHDLLCMLEGSLEVSRPRASFRKWHHLSGMGIFWLFEVPGAILKILNILVIISVVAARK